MGWLLWVGAKERNFQVTWCYQPLSITEGQPAFHGFSVQVVLGLVLYTEDFMRKISYAAGGTLVDELECG